MKRYNMSKIMTRAWTNYRRFKELSFGECLHRSWLSAKAETVNAARVSEAKAAAGIAEDVNTWSGWKALGYEVIHGSKCVFQTSLIWGSKGSGAIYRASFFGRSQVSEVIA